MPGKAAGRVAVELPWLCPNTDSLIGLAENPAGLSALAASDPALFAFLVRFSTGESASPFLPPDDRLLSPTLPETAAAYLKAVPAGWLDPRSKVAATVQRLTERAVAFAVRIARHTSRVASEAAETAARLAPLGWYAITAANPSDAGGCLRDPSFAENPMAVQEQWWGLNHAAIARRLAVRWRFPRWLAVLLDNLDLPFAAVRDTGADVDLLAVVSLALQLAEEQTIRLGLSRPQDRSEALATLYLDEDSLRRLVESADRESNSPPASASVDPNPHHAPLVVNLLRMAAQARRRNGVSLAVRLEERIDDLHRRFAELGLTGEIRVRDAKLTALAELAAGAGHEINNPLTVISGNAQRLLRTEADDDRADTLRAIIRQSQRISGILRDLMQFARPKEPDVRRIAASDLMLAVREELRTVAEERGVRLELIANLADVGFDADPKQLHQALAAIVRNGIEAAGSDGWVRLSCEIADETVRYVVEDSGPGLTPGAVEHAFDPFFSGRSAGRGRGLGLPVAWQLARQNGAEVRFELVPNGPTRFVLSLPAALDECVSFDRRSA